MSEEHHPPEETPVPGPYTEPSEEEGDEENDEDEPELPGTALALGVYRRNKLSAAIRTAATR